MDIIHEEGWDEDEFSVRVKPRKRLRLPKALEKKWRVERAAERERSKRIKPCDFKNPEWQALEREYEQLSSSPYKDRLFIKLYGRIGMLETDAFQFEPHPVKMWSLVQVQNRLRWLHSQKVLLLGKPGKEKEAQGLQEKIRKYTKELFRRYSARNLDALRVEQNRKRRLRRASAKKKRLVTLAKQWFEKRKATRKATKLLTNG